MRMKLVSAKVDYNLQIKSGTKKTIGNNKGFHVNVAAISRRSK